MNNNHPLPKEYACGEYEGEPQKVYFYLRLSCMKNMYEKYIISLISSKRA